MNQPFQDNFASELLEISQHPIVNAVMNATGGLFAVLNENRQVLAVNKALLQYLGIDEPNQVIGVHPGEMLGCLNVLCEPEGCGASLACATCGNKNSVMECLEKGLPVEKKQVVSVSRHGVRQDLVLNVRTVPLSLDGRKVILMFMQDITQRQNWAALESTFFHDIGNMLSNLLFASELLHQSMPPEQKDASRRMLDITNRVVREFSIQRSLVRTGAPNYQPMRSEFSIKEFFSEIESLYTSSPQAVGKDVVYPDIQQNFTVVTDPSLLSRVIQNMVTNALEASIAGDCVRIGCELIDDDDHGVLFTVWNPRAIPLEIIPRIFQRNFTTKSEEGHGLGTFSMKLFGESYLGGKVSFTTSSELGTHFEFWLPF